MHFTMETTTFVMPGSSFRSFNIDGEDSVRSFAVPRRNTQPRAGGMIGAAFNLLGDVLASQQPHQQTQTHSNSRRGSKQANVEDDFFSSDEEDPVRQERSNKPRSFVSKVAEKIINNSQGSRKTYRDREASLERATPRTSKPHGRSRSYRTEQRHPAWTSTRGPILEDSSEDSYDYSSESDDEDYENFQNSRRHDSRRPFANDHSRRGSAPQRGPTQQSRPRQPPRSFSTTERIFTPSSHAAFEAFFGTNGTRRSTRSIFDDDDDFNFRTSFGGSPFGGFESIFNDDFFFALPRSSFAAGTSTNPNHGQQTRPGPSPTVFPTPAPAPSKPPANTLKAEEAKKLFLAYNTRWNALSPTDPNIPYPCRGMKAAALSSRETIWAPLVDAPISTWSEETVMQANAQAFFIGVAGLTPKYTEAPGTGRIVMGYDKARATPDQVRGLVDILKKERTRWHSDKLGKRNGGVTAGPNETLQRDERARAVFHAVCELIEVAQ